MNEIEDTDNYRSIGQRMDEIVASVDENIATENKKIYKRDLGRERKNQLPFQTNPM